MRAALEPWESAIPSLVAAFRSGDADLLAALDRLEARFEAIEPHVLAFVAEDGRFDRLRREARRLLEQYPDPAARPPLFGLPVGVKDIFHVDGLVTRAGSRLDPELLQGEEAACVTALRQAGALVLGKTVTTEFAYFAPGPTRNPHNPEHTPGGSSSGSAAAVAAGLCLFAFGTQTIGSINRPAAFCGVVGYKPSRGRVSAAGVIPLAESLDHVGYMAPTVGDAAYMAPFVCGDWRDVEPASERPVLGIPAGPYLDHAGPEGRAQFDDDCRRLSAAGYELRSVAVMPDFEEIRRQHVLLVEAEAAAYHGARFAIDEWFAGPAFSGSAELFPSAVGLARRELPYHPRTAALIRAGRAHDDAAADAARAGRDALRDRLAAAMGDAGVDAWITPSAVGPAPHGLDSTGDPIMNLPWSYAGLPALTVPSGRNEDGLPLAVQLVGRPQEDERLLRVGLVVEEVIGD